jgi:hypothetical protein
MSFLQGFISIFLGIVFLILEGTFLAKSFVSTARKLENNLARRGAVLARLKGLKDTPLVPRMKEEATQWSLLIAALPILVIENFLFEAGAFIIFILSTIISMAISIIYQSQREQRALDKAERQRCEVVRLFKILHRVEKNLVEVEADVINKKAALDKQKNILKVVFSSVSRDLSCAQLSTSGNSYPLNNHTSWYDWYIDPAHRAIPGNLHYYIDNSDP